MAPMPAAPKLEAIDPRKAESDAKGLVTEIYESLGHGDTDSLQTLLAPAVTVFGPRRGDAVGKREDAIVTLGKLVSAKQHPQLHSSALTIMPAPGGHSAWAFDVVNVGPDPLVLLAVLSNADDLWLVDSAQLANAPAEKDIKRELKEDAIVPPGASAVAKIDPNARLAVDKFTRGLADQTVWGADLMSRDDALVIGPAAGEVARGKKDVTKLWKKRLELNTREIGVNQTAAGLTRDGQLVWISTVATRAADGDDPTPIRVFAVYVRDGAGWTMLALDESLAIDQPGTGTAFRKIVPPPPPPKVVEKPPETVATTAPPTKKKKKDKKPVDDDDADKPVPPPKKVVKAPEPDPALTKKKDKKKPSDDDTAAASPKKVGKERKFVEDDDSNSPPKKVAPDDSDSSAKKKKKVTKAPDDGDDPPSKKKKVTKAPDDGDDPPPKKKKVTKAPDDGDDPPPKKKKKFSKSIDDDDAAPKKKVTKAPDDGDDPPPKKKKKKPVVDDAQKADDSGDDPPPKKKLKKKPKHVDDDDAKADDDGDDPPPKKKKKKKKPADDDD